MSEVKIASLLPVPLNLALQQRLPDVVIVQAATHLLHELPAEVRILLAFPVGSGNGFPTEPPKGWPGALEWIHLGSSGLDGYPRWLLESGIPVSSSRGASALAVSEYCLAAIFAQAKQIPQIWQQQPNQPRPQRLGQIKGSTLGLLGLGAIGATLATLAQGLGMKVVALKKNGPAHVPGVETASDIHALFTAADHLVLALPSNADTRHIISREVLRSAKPGLHLINIARGALIDNDALLNALDEGVIGHATLDVSAPEPLPAGHPFFQNPGISLSAHVSALLKETQVNTVALIERNLQNFLYQRPLENRIN